MFNRSPPLSPFSPTPPPLLQPDAVCFPTSLDLEISTSQAIRNLDKGLDAAHSTCEKGRGRVSCAGKCPPGFLSVAATTSPDRWSVQRQQTFPLVRAAV